MNIRFRHAWRWGLVLLAAASQLALAQTAAIVKKIEIRHEGPPAASDALIRANIRAKEGEPYNPNTVADDVSALWKTGFFYNVQQFRESFEDGLKLIYQVQGNPTVTQIRFTGNRKFSTAKLQKKTSSKVGEPLDPRKLFNDTQELLKLYQNAGLRQTEIKPVSVIDNKLGKGTVTFQIAEAPKVKIRDVDFVGAEAFKQRKLRHQIKTRRHWMFSWLTGSGVLKEDEFQEDKERLAEFYRNEGFLDFDIKEVKFEQVSPRWLIVHFQVYEGARYRVGSVEFQGNTLFTADEIMSGAIVRVGPRIRRGLTLTPGRRFSPKELASDREGVEDYYGARGYIDAQVAPLRLPNTEKGTIDLLYRINEGKKAFIEKIEIKGNTKTKDRVIRRELAVNPGEVFDMVRVRLSTNRLYGLNYFAKVDAQQEPTEMPERRNLVIGVEEKGTGDIRAGLGFSTIDELVGFVEISQGNFALFKPPYFLGTCAGQKIRLRAHVGTARQDYQLTFIEPWFLGHKLALSTDFEYRELRYYGDMYDVKLMGARVSLTRTLWNDFWLGSVGYNLENIGLVNLPGPVVSLGPDGTPTTHYPVPAEIRKDAGYTLESKILTSLAYDTRNSVLLPNRGQRTAFAAEVGGGPLGGDADFYKLQLSTSRYFRGLAPGHVLELTGRIGVVDSYGFDQDVHLFERFFLGGLTSLRGYKFRSIGPYNLGPAAYPGDPPAGTEPVGGRTMWFAGAEYSIPIIERLRLAAFYDIGNVYPNAYSFKTLNSDYGFYTDNWGVGIRLNIPMLGPLRLDYALPLTHDRFVGSSGRFQFGVGFTRDY